MNYEPSNKWDEQERWEDRLLLSERLEEEEIEDENNYEPNWE